MERPRKRELRGLNAKAWDGDKDVFPVDRSLDSTMKKNTAFIRRLRTTLNASTVSTILQETRTLSLHKYLSEIISACYEGLTKLKVPADIAAGVEVFSALHQRFGPEEFTAYISWHIGRGLSTPDKAYLKSLGPDVQEKEEKDRLARHRVLLKVATELWLVGALRSLEDVTRPEDAAKTKENSKPKTTPNVRPEAADAEPFPLEVLKEILDQDGKHANLSMIASFIKTFAWDLLGKRNEPEDGHDSADDPPLADAHMHERFRNVLKRYYEGAKLHLIRDQASLTAQSKRNAEAYVRSGEIFEDRQANYDKMVKAQEKFISNMTTLSEVLELEMPGLKNEESAGAATDGTIGLVKTGEYLRGEGEGPGIWEDEEERRFYENIIDLKDRVPGILLEDGKKKKGDGDDQIGKKADETKLKAADAEETGDSHTEGQPKDDPAGDQSMSIANKTTGAQVDALLARLPDIMTKDAADQIAHDFCYLNSKASRKRLLKSVQEVPRGRSDLLPFYSRVATTLGKYMPDMPNSLVTHLNDEFRSLQRRKQKDSLGGVRTSNIRYLAELTKFGVVPEHVIFHCLKVSLDDFSRMNIEIICHLLENCGRYLLRTPETSPRMKSFLETLNRKKSAQHLGQQERLLIENATYFVDPPERAAIEQKERTPIELFIRKLVYEDLLKRNSDRIAKQIRKLHWEEPEIVRILYKIFSKPHKMKYSNIQFLPAILGALQRFHQEFCIGVIDDLCEKITLGLEINDFKFNQKRLSEVKYLGELYAYRMIDSSVIFEMMYKIALLGHGGWPKPGDVNPLDLSDDFFRIRLLCSLLETCGIYYEKGRNKSKLDFFLSFFQYYIQTKELMPMDIEFLVQDAFGTVRPQWKIAKTLQEAGDAFSQACKENYDMATPEKAAEPTDLDETEEIDEDAEVSTRRSPIDGDAASSGDDAEHEQNLDAEDQTQSTQLGSDADDDDQQIVVTRPEDQRDPEADAEFDRELAKMMAESVETRKTERRPMADLSLPLRRPQRDTANHTEETNGTGPSQNTTKFSLLSKRGNKPQTRSIDLPSDSSFAVAMRNQREAEKAEQQKIKELVLSYDHMRGDDRATDAPDGNMERPSSSRHNAGSAAGGGRVDGMSAVASGSPAVSSDRAGGGNQKNGKRGNQASQSRKLQLSDIDCVTRP